MEIHSYDDGNRVTSYNRQDAYPGARETQSWIYDGAGNWDSTTIDGNLQDRDHSDSDQLEGIGSASLDFDPRGNLLADERGNEYEWDLDNRIVLAEGSGYTDIEYRYDALGRRIVRKQGTRKEVLLWWGNTEQSEHKHQATQTTIQNDLQANPSEAALNTVFARALEGDKQDIQYFHKNYLDHVMAVSDDNGDLLEHYRYTAFGEPEIYSPTGTKLAATDIDNDILWNVRRYEAANGLYMYKYRDYDAATGRWPSRDPIEEEGGMNLYGFIRNNGLNRIDFLGHEPGIGASVGGGFHGPGLGFGIDVNVTSQITTKCEMCVTYSATVRAGPGGGIHGGGGFTLSGNVQEGPSTTVGFGFWGANGPVGALGYVEVDPITRLPNGGGARREGGAGGTFGPQVTFGCTGCASIKYGAQVAQTIAMARALKCIYDQVKEMNQD